MVLATMPAASLHLSGTAVALLLALNVPPVMLLG